MATAGLVAAAFGYLFASWVTVTGGGSTANIGYTDLEWAEASFFLTQMHGSLTGWGILALGTLAVMSVWGDGEQVTGPGFWDEWGTTTLAAAAAVFTTAGLWEIHQVAAEGSQILFGTGASIGVGPGPLIATIGTMAAAIAIGCIEGADVQQKVAA